jgi:hypothetical protein
MKVFGGVELRSLFAIKFGGELRRNHTGPAALFPN